MSGLVKYLTLLVALWLVVAPAGAAATLKGSPPTQTTAPLATAGEAADELDRIRSLLVSWRGSRRRALLQRRTRVEPRQYQVGVQERHLGARRHRHRQRID